jgi:membrane protease YdiL (CAAX protease family)
MMAVRLRRPIIEPDHITDQPGIFFSHYGLRSGWRCLLFLLLFAVCIAGTMMPLGNVLYHELSVPARLLVTEVFSTFWALFCTWMLARFVDHKPFTSFGLPPAGAPRKFVFGIIAGFLALSSLLIILKFCGFLQFDGFALQGSSVWTYASLWAVVFLFVGLSEELITRGYLLFALTQGIGFWPAAALLSALFAAGHIHNPGEDAIGIAAAGLIGLVLAWTVKWTGSLWWAIGFHAAWDWAESFFYGTPDSGGVLPMHLLNTSLHGPAWLSGGSVGPEGSAIVLPLILLVMLVVRISSRQTPVPELKRLK